MVQQPVILQLNAQLIKEIDALATKTQVTREQLISELVKEGLQRQRVRAKIHALSERKSRSPATKRALERMTKFRSTLKAVPEKTLQKDIDEAIAAVRKSKVTK